MQSLGVRAGADTVQHLRCDTDTDCKCGLMGTCLYLGSLRKSLSNSETQSSQTQYQSKGIPRKLAHLASGTAPHLGPADKRCDLSTEVLNRSCANLDQPQM